MEKIKDWLFFSCPILFPVMIIGVMVYAIGSAMNQNRQFKYKQDVICVAGQYEGYHGKVIEVYNLFVKVKLEDGNEITIEGSNLQSIGQ